MADCGDVLGHSEPLTNSALSAKERGDVFDGLMNHCRWDAVFYAWRPNPPDDADDHLIERAVAARSTRR